MVNFLQANGFLPVCWQLDASRTCLGVQADGLELFRLGLVLADCADELGDSRYVAGGIIYWPSVAYDDKLPTSLKDVA